MRNLSRYLGVLGFWIVPIIGFSNDYFLTISGGYDPSGNQASLEANVQFFQRVIRERHPAPSKHLIYFADGFDTAHDLQTLAPKRKSESPAMELLNSVFDLDRDRFDYRNHQVPDIRGALNPPDIRNGLEEISEQLTDGDRLIIYVTAHGSAAKGNDPFNTSITCWKKRPLSMKSFSEWLEQVPDGVPVVMIMAQCYCGGFANTVFVEGNPEKGFTSGLRVGFFAQRHDLPAAGCRPDVENDEEYSSYFWGAFLGRSRTGKPASKVDINADGRVSFAEAHAYAVIASQTIDIPLTTSDIFLRQYSRIAGYDDEDNHEVNEDASVPDQAKRLLYFTGTVEEIAARGNAAQRFIVLELAKQLEIPRTTDITKVTLMSEAQHEQFRQIRRFGRRGRGSRRRDLLGEIVAKWPELESPDNWSTVEVLKSNQSEAFLEQVRQLDNYEPFQQSLADRNQATKDRTNAELKEVQFRRLIHSLETILYAQNLNWVADPKTIDKYRAILAIESTSLDR
ncbi:MAG: hypothetical protein SGI77_27490 [Pirellulaceae bacterium]|nr:hypothetical protein [Pirellulaceae bacterium]